jgi:hypothetical protein
MASIYLNDAMILPHAENLDGSTFRKGQHASVPDFAGLIVPLNRLHRTSGVIRRGNHDNFALNGLRPYYSLSNEPGSLNS